MIKKFKFGLPLIALLLISCAGDISSQSSFESSSSNTFTVSFDSRGGSNVPNQIVEPNSFVAPPQVSKEGHILEGWYTSLNGGLTLENKIVNSSKKIISDVDKDIINQIYEKDYTLIKSVNFVNVKKGETL